MIDQTTSRILAARAANQRRKEQSERFERLVALTDTVLWQLEEMNRDGIKTIPGDLRVSIREELTEIPRPVIDVFRDTEVVQEVLDSIFEVQERLFRWKDPELESDEEGRLAG
jgi:hypothetical protein